MVYRHIHLTSQPNVEDQELNKQSLMKRTFFLLFLTLSFGFVIAQNEVNKKNMVGFGCTKADLQSKSVSKALSLLRKAEHQKIISMLDSKSQAEQFLAVVFLEKLESDSTLSLAEEHKQKMKLISNSKRKVSFCAGCTYWDKMTLNKALAEDSKPRRLVKLSLERVLN